MDYIIPINNSEIVPQRTINLSAFSIQFSSSDIQIASSKKGSPLSNSEMKQGCRLGMDSHADMTCVSRHAKIMEIYHGKSCVVMPFHDSYKSMKNVQTVNAAYAYDTNDGNTVILRINQALNFSDGMENALLCPNQARINGVVIDDIPKHLDYRQQSNHSIWFPDENIHLPLEMHGPISHLQVRYPSDEELEFCTELEVTSSDDWVPAMCEQTARKDLTTSALHASMNESACELNDFDHMLYYARVINGVTHTRTSDITSEQLAKLWSISLDSAKRTLSATDQESLSVLEGKITRRVKTKAHQRRYKQMGGYLGMFCTDTFKSNVTSLRGNKYIQLFCNRGNFNAAYPMKSKSHAPNALDRFLHEVGIPIEMLSDGAKELTLGEFKKTCQRHKIYQTITEPHSPWQNPSELSGGILKRKIRHDMRSTNTPIRLWDYCWEYEAAIKSLTCTDHIYLDNVTPFEKVFGYTPRIGEYLMHKWYDWVHYHEPIDVNRQLLGRYLGPAHTAGQGYAHYILSADGKVKTRSTIYKIDAATSQSVNFQDEQARYTEKIELTIGNYSNSTFENTDEYDGDDPYNSLFEEDELDDANIQFQEVDENGEIVEQPEADDAFGITPISEQQDKYINMKVPLPHKGEVLEGTISHRKRDANGNLIGNATDNPITDSRLYHVDFPDGSVGEYTTNSLVENLYSHVDDEGRSHSLLKHIVDSSADDTAIQISQGIYKDPDTGMRKRAITTKGWKLLVEWADGTSSWIPLKDLKESNPLETAEFAERTGIIDEPAFAWWAKHVLKKRTRLLKAVHHRLAKKSMKFGIDVPKSVAEGLQFDQVNGNTFWGEAIQKELTNVRVAFDLLEDGEKSPVGSKLIPYHFIFDVRMDLSRKARLVAGGHRHKDVPAHATFSSVASRDSVRLTFMLAALNNINILSCDIGNAFIQAKNTQERVHVIVGPELFGKENEGKIAVISRALYGLKSASAAWRNHFSKFILETLGYQETWADPDVYRKACTKQDGTKYYSYLVIYVDDVLCMHHNPKEVMDIIGDTFRLKGNVESPTRYLGTDIKVWKNHNDDGEENTCWAMGSSTYVKEAVRVAEAQMKKHGLSYTSSRRQGRATPFSNQEYRPELDVSEILTDDLVTVYQNLIGVLRWSCELGRLDILHEVSILSQYLAQPRKGHIDQALNIFFYLKNHDRSWMIMDHSKFEIDWIPRDDKELHPRERAKLLKKVYRDAVDELPHNMPVPLGEEIDINAFVDADHAGNKVTRRSHTGVIIFCNLAPVVWYSKRQNTVETSTFGAEFIALRIAVELIESLRYKLRMFGVPLAGPANVFCDNESVVKSSSYVDSVLKKKHCSIAYHRIREAVAAEKILIYYERTDTNLADLLTKPLSATKRKGLVQAILT